jgi:hypothetical protein
MEARALATEVINRLTDVVELTQQQLSQDQKVYRRAVLQVAATDSAVQQDLTPPPGVIWNIEHYAVTSGPGGGFALYVDDVQPQNLVDGEFGTAEIAADDTTVVIAEGSRLILRFYSQPGGQVCTVNLLITEIMPK